MRGNNSENAENMASNPAIHFGRQVRKARRERGWTLRDLSRATGGLSPGYLSDVENGKKGVSEDVAGRMDAAFPDRRGWFTEFHNDSRQWAPPGYRSWAEYEDQATHIRAWCPGTLHGLVQTADYARTLSETVPGVPAEIINARVQARMDRQRRILHRENPPFVWIGIDEPALYREVGSPEIMVAALDNLLAIAALPNVTVQVVPAIAHPGPISELIVTDNHAAYCEHLAGGYTFTDEVTVTSMDRLITTIQGESHRVSESVRMIERVRDIWALGASPLTRVLPEGRA